MPADEELEYVGFWARTGASLIDTVLLMCVVTPLVVWVYGWAYFDPERTGMLAGPADGLISWVLPAAAVLAFWVYKQATPGKMAIGSRIVDARTGAPVTVTQSLVRYLGYYVSLVPLGLGFMWVGFDARKQGWHDKMAGTVVVRPKHRGISPVTFDPPKPPGA